MKTDFADLVNHDTSFSYVRKLTCNQLGGKETVTTRVQDEKREREREKRGTRIRKNSILYKRPRNGPR